MQTAPGSAGSCPARCVVRLEHTGTAAGTSREAFGLADTFSVLVDEEGKSTRCPPGKDEVFALPQGYISSPCYSGVCGRVVSGEPAGADLRGPESWGGSERFQLPRNSWFICSLFQLLVCTHPPSCGCGRHLGDMTTPHSGMACCSQNAQ